jgi:hypothetical protein
VIDLYGQREESLSYKTAENNYFHPIKIMERKSNFRQWMALKMLILDLSYLKIL